MPGKYSHSVVLADYSSRGIIDLPNDQHVAYLRSSPYSASQHSRQNSKRSANGSSNIQPRSQSALAYSGQYSYRSGQISSPSRRVIVDSAVRPRGEVVKDVKGHRPATSHTSHPSTDRGKLQTPVPPKDSIHNQTTTTTTTRTSITPEPVHLKSPQNQVEPSSQDGTQQSKYEKPTRIRAEHFLREMSAPPPSQNIKTIPKSPRAIDAPSEHMTTPADLAPVALGSSTIALQPQARSHSSQSRLSEMHGLGLSEPVHHGASQQTRLPVPQTETAEPNLGMSSDVEDHAFSNLDASTRVKPSTMRTISAQTGQQTSRLESPLPAGPKTSNSTFRARTNHSISSERSEPEVPRDVGSSSLNSHGKLDSMTSSSTASSRGAAAAAAAQSGKPSEVKNSTTQQSQDWRLPEIDENGTFGPDFFTQGPEDFMLEGNDKESVDSFLNRPLGTISAGRDVDFSKNDDDGNESENDEACPPDIGRFRDEESRSAPFLQKMKSDSMIGKGTSPSLPVTKAKKIGFFARLRSKSRQRG